MSYDNRIGYGNLDIVTATPVAVNLIGAGLPVGATNMFNILGAAAKGFYVDSIDLQIRTAVGGPSFLTFYDAPNPGDIIGATSIWAFTMTLPFTSTFYYNRIIKYKSSVATQRYLHLVANAAVTGASLTVFIGAVSTNLQ